LRLKVGETLSIGGAEVRRSEETIEYKDYYTAGTLIIPRNAKVDVIATPPLNVPKPKTKCLFLSLKTPAIISEGAVLKFYMPYELMVVINKKPVLALSPFKVKFILLGNPIEGQICRNYLSEIVGEPAREGRIDAVIEIDVVVGDTGLVEGVLIEDVGDVGITYEEVKGKLLVTYESIKGKLEEKVIKAKGPGFNIGGINHLFTPLKATNPSKSEISWVRGP